MTTPVGHDGRMGSLGDNSRIIAGRYLLEVRLGGGGMGVVWRATDQLLGRRVAVKELPVCGTPSDEETAQQRERTLREARAVAQLRHPHIVVVHDVVVHDERPYIVMELVEGTSLAGRIARSGPLGPQAAARVGLDLLGALGTAHAAGVLHRDLKPANVLLEEATGRVVLTDFGIAQVSGATTLTENGTFVGSPEYTAPERMSGERTGPKSDLWSLGALLAAAVSGESPFHRDSIGGVLHAVVFDDIHPPPGAEPIAPVVLGLLERDPERRLDAAGAERLLRAYVDTGVMPPLRGTEAGTGWYPPALRSGRTGLSRFAGLHGLPGLHGRHLPARREPPAPEPVGPAGSATAPIAPPVPSPASVDVAARRRQSRTMVISAALVAAVAGGAVSVAALLFGPGGEGDGTRTVPPSSASPDTPDDPGAPRPTATSTVTRTPDTVRPSTPEAPKSYRVVKDPRGFTLAVPESYVRETDGPRTYYTSPGRVFRIGITEGATVPGGPVAAQRRAAALGPRLHPGYRDAEVTETTRSGRPAALWQFTWDGTGPGAEAGARHTFDLCWEGNGRTYHVWVTSPASRTKEARRYFDTAVDTFVRR